MAEDEINLVPIEVANQIDHLREGGLISHALSGPERGMDRLIKSHLDRIALLEARGDSVPERPMYIFNPDSKLLISYALRRDPNPARSGLFAEIVELDEQGKPRHGVGVVNPFQTTTGFIEVAIGDNQHGFAPSFVDMKLDSDDPLKMVPPNIPMAELLVMLRTKPISEEESLEEFLRRTDAERADFIKKAVTRKNEQYLPTTQGLDEETHPNLHLIISDYNTSSLEKASRAIGLFPVVKTVDELLTTARELNNVIRRMGPDAVEDFEPHTFYKDRWLKGNSICPGFITFHLAIEEKPLRIDIDSNFYNSTYRESVTLAILNKLVNNNPVFANLRDVGFQFEYRKEVARIGHGHYEQQLDPNDRESMESYTDWLRKIRLDLALTLYLRGLSEIV